MKGLLATRNIDAMAGRLHRKGLGTCVQALRQHG
jgi:hypothetical protein